MKYLFPKVTILMTVHMKADTLESAINSVLQQTRQDFQFIIADSGLWHGRNDERSDKMRWIYERYYNHEKIEWIFTGEQPDDYKKYCMVSKVTNAVLREDDLVRGEYLSTFYDDDLYEYTFIKKMAGFLDNNHDYDAVRCSERRIEIPENPLEAERETGVFVADKDFFPGDNMDCVVDGMQVMMRMGAIRHIDYPYLPEAEESCSHSDGIFFNKFGAMMTKMGHINEVLCTHRATPVSTYTPTAEKKRLI